jgi:hypothetical protein
MSITPDQWNAALKAVFAKAATDIDFRAKCLGDSPAAFEEAAGIPAPVGIKFVEEADGASIVLPQFGADPDELTELEELDSVAGGDPPYLHPQSTSAVNCWGSGGH